MAPTARRPIAKFVATTDHNCVNRFAYLQDKTLYSRKHTKDDSATKGLGCIDYPLTSLAIQPRCPATCSACSSQYRPLHWQEDIPVCRYVNKHDDAEASSIIQRHVAETKQNLEYVAARIESCGNALVKRWLKRTTQKRAALLLQAMPGMFRHRSDLHDASKLCCGDLSNHRDRLLLPYLNAELLSEEPLHMLALLHHRTSASPSAWIMFDSQQMKDTFAQGVLEASYNPHCVLLSGSDEEFGSLVPWDEERAHRWEIIGFPRAELILEAQRVLSKFLADMVGFLCPTGTDMASSGRDKWDDLVAREFDPDTETANRSSYRYGAFVSPPTLSLEHILESFDARLQAAKDESALLQTDPAFTRHILAIAESSNAHRHGCECCSVPSLLILMNNGVDRHRFWRLVRDDAQHALDFCQKHNVDFQAPQSISKESLHIIRTLEFVLEAEFAWLIKQLRRLALDLGAVDEHVKFEGNDHPEVVLKRATRDPVFKALDVLVHHRAPDSRYPCYTLAILDHYTSEAYPKNHARFSYALSECLADIHAVDEAIMAIKCTRPNCGPAVVQFDSSNPASYRNSSVILDEIYLDHVSSRWADFDSVLWPALDEFMKAPIPSDKVNRKALQHFDASHLALATFWERFRATRSQLLNEAGCSEEKRDELMEILQPSRSLEYYEDRDKERRSLIDAIEQKELADAERRSRVSRKENIPLAPIQTFWGEKRSTSPVSPQPRPKEKEKRRDSAITTGQQPEEDGLSAVADNLHLLDISRETLVVSPRAYDVFRRMFISFGKYTNSNLPWDHLVKAMSEANVTASQASGSRVTFREAKGGKGLVLHQPHANSINPIMLRRFGKRFQQHWGWDLDMFVERE